MHVTISEATRDNRHFRVRDTKRKIASEALLRSGLAPFRRNDARKSLHDVGTFFARTRRVIFDPSILSNRSSYDKRKTRYSFVSRFFSLYCKLENTNFIHSLKPKNARAPFSGIVHQETFLSRIIRVQARSTKRLVQRWIVLSFVAKRDGFFAITQVRTKVYDKLVKLYLVFVSLSREARLQPFERFAARIVERVNIPRESCLAAAKNTFERRTRSPFSFGVIGRE